MSSVEVEPKAMSLCSLVFIDLLRSMDGFVVDRRETADALRNFADLVESGRVLPDVTEDETPDEDGCPRFIIS